MSFADTSAFMSQIKSVMANQVTKVKIKQDKTTRLTEVFEKAVNIRVSSVAFL